MPGQMAIPLRNGQLVACLMLAVGCSAAGLAAGKPPELHRGDETPVAGRSLAEWRDVMSRLDLTDRASAQFVPGLVAVMESRTVPWFTRRQAALTLGRLGTISAAAVPRVTSLLDEVSDDPETAAEYWASKALALYGPVAASAAPALVKRVRAAETSRLVRLSALEALSQIGTAHEAVLSTLGELAREPRGLLPELPPAELHELQRLACEGLGAMGPGAAEMAPVLARLLESDDALLRRAAAEALGRFGPRAEIAGLALADRVLLETEPEVRDAALVALAQLGPGQLPRVLPWLSAEEPQLRRSALQVLKNWGTAARHAEPDVRALVGDSEPLVRIAAGATLAAITDDVQPELALVLAELQSPDREVRITAARLLIEWGARSSEVANGVRPLVGDARRDVRVAAQHVLDQIEQRGTP